MISDIHIVVHDFHNTIPAVSTENSDGSYTIFLNSRLTREKQADGYIHELKHILKLDFENKCSNDIDKLEADRHTI